MDSLQNTPHQEGKGHPGISAVRQRVRLVGLCGALMITVLACWLQWRAMRSGKDTLSIGRSQLAQMSLDASRIHALRTAPKAAASRNRTNEELLAQVERALSASGIGSDHWVQSVPQPPRRLPQSDYRQHATRFYFEGVTLRQLAAFAHHLQADDATLQVSSLNLTNRKPETNRFDVEVAVSYLVYAPKQQ